MTFADPVFFHLLAELNFVVTGRDEGSEVLIKPSDYKGT